MVNVILLFSGMLFFWFIYNEDESLWYKMQKKACKKYCGHCELCDCWSCCRKEYIDEYKNLTTEKYLSLGGKNG